MIGDRRKHQRQKNLIAARVHVANRQQRFVTTDISPIGAFFAATESPEVGAVIEVALRPAGVKVAPVRLSAAVVRVVQGGGPEQPGFGVRWVSAHCEVGGAALYEFLRHVLKIPALVREQIGNERVVTFEFPVAGEDFPQPRRIPDGGPPLIKRPRASATTPGGRQAGSRTISEAIGGRHQLGQTAARPPGFSPANLHKNAEPFAPSAERARPEEPAAPSPAAPSAAAPSAAAKASEVTGSSTERRAWAPTSRRTSGVIQADNVMVGAPIRRQGEHADLASHRRRVSERSAAPESPPAQRPGRFTGIPSAEGLAAERLLPEFDPGGRRPGRARAGRQSGAHAAFQERSLIFEGGSMSAVGGPAMTNMDKAAGEPARQGSIKVDVPVTYELDNRFVVGQIVAAAPLAVEILTSSAAPQLDQNLVVNMPIRVDKAYATVYLVGKLLRVPEQRDEGSFFVLHIERVLEGKNEGAYSQFLASAHGA